MPPQSCDERTDYGRLILGDEYYQILILASARPHAVGRLITAVDVHERLEK